MPPLSPDPVELERRLSATLVPALPPESQDYVRGLALHYSLSETDIRWIAQAARDLEMWRETSLSAWWSATEKEVEGARAARGQVMLARLREHLDSLTTRDKSYPSKPLIGLRRPKDELVPSRSTHHLFGQCPGNSDGVLCCGVLSLDAVVGCPYGCSYCPVKTYLGNKIEIAVDAAERLRQYELPADGFHHIGTGHASDILLLGKKHGLLDAVCDLAKRHPNALIELRTKSDRFNYEHKKRLPANIVCSWSLNTETIIRNEEQRTAPLRSRLQAARKAAEGGRQVAFHIHPLVRYRGWHEEYASLASQLLTGFSPDDVAFVSIAAMSLTPGVVRDIRSLGGESKVLQMPMAKDGAGNSVYPDDLKVELFRLVYETLRPWHGKVFIYLCGEPPHIWERVTGTTYSSSAALQDAFARHAQTTVPGLRDAVMPAPAGSLS